jgi:phosphatidylglycerol:prolipoprotein diacylglycerol transferase
MNREFKIIFYSIIALIGAVLLFAAIRGYFYIPAVIDLGIYQLRLYGVIIAGAILTGFLLARKNSWKFGLSIEEIDKLAFWLVIFALLGARIYYVLFEWNYYQDNLEEIFKIWHGGLSIYGGIIAGLSYLYIASKKKAYSFFQITDLIALVLPLGQMIGRFANFVNQEAFGKPTSLPWGLYIEPPKRPYEYYSQEYFHPTFLYEVAWNLLVFFILNKYVSKSTRGYLTFIYLALYSFGRFFIEWVRLDSSYVYGFKVDMIISAIIFVIAMVGVCAVRRKKGKLSTGNKI